MVAMKDLKEIKNFRKDLSVDEQSEYLKMYLGIDERVSKKWSQIDEPRSLDDAPTDEVLVYGPITNNSMFAEFFGGTSPESFKIALANAEPKDGVVTVRINSPGGEVSAGSAIRQAMKEHKGEIIAKVDGLAASAATGVAMAADKVLMAELSEAMFHLPHSIAFGNSLNMQAAKEMLEATNQSMAQVYDQSLAYDDFDFDDGMGLMKGSDGNGTWVNAQQAIKMNFADGYIESGDATPNEPGAVSSTAFMGIPLALLTQPATKTQEPQGGDKVMEPTSPTGTAVATPLFDPLTGNPIEPATQANQTPVPGSKEERWQAIRAMSDLATAAGMPDVAKLGITAILDDKPISELAEQIASLSIMKSTHSDNVKDQAGRPYDPKLLMSYMLNPNDSTLQQKAAKEIDKSKAAQEEMSDAERAFITPQSTVISMRDIFGADDYLKQEAHMNGGRFSAPRADIPVSDNKFKPTNIRESDWLPLLFEQNALASRCTVFTDLKGDQKFPAVNTIADVTYNEVGAAAEASASTAMAVTTREVSLTPHQATGHINVSFLSLLNSPVLDTVIRSTLRMHVTDTIDENLLVGVAASHEPTGILTIAGTNNVDYGDVSATEYSPTYKNVLAGRQKVVEANAMRGGETYVWRPDKAVDLMIANKTGTGSDPVWGDGDSIRGIPALESNYFATGNADDVITGFFAEMRHIYVGIWANLIITLDTVSNDAQAVYRFRYFHDQALPYPKAISKFAQTD